MARRSDFGFTAIEIKGGLLPSEFLRTVAELKAGDQGNAGYGLTRSLNLRDEIGRHWQIARDLWVDFRGNRGKTGAALHKAAVDGWLAPLLTQVLGFNGLEPTGPVTLGERVFPLTHRAAKDTLSLVLLPPAYELDRAYAECGEEGRRRTPFGLMQEYLNAGEDAVWGIVSNGLLLRVLRDNPSLTRPAWIEFDLERVFEDEVYADFAAFWLLAHGSRFEPREGGRAPSCIIERWRGKAQETGERARDKLRDGVATALLALGNGFVKHPANDPLRARLAEGSLTAHDLHQQLLRLVYRCLFLLTIEDRDLLHPPDTPEEARRLWREGYSLSQLRERALRTRGFDAQGDLWQQLKITFMALERGASEIGAPALDSALFDRTQTADLFEAELANAALLGAIKALSFFTPDKSRSLARINYRDMNTEEFGSVYESLLELHPFVETAPSAFGYVGLDGAAAKGSERKLSGSYYTPDSLVQELIKSALEPVIRKTATDNPYRQREALLGLDIIDPACGSGHFLLAAARRLAAEIARIDAAPDAPTEAQRQHALREVVRHCIYGVDRNQLAVELCKTALWIETVEPGRPLSFLDHRIRCGDSLIGVFDLAVLEAGIPDAAYSAKTGDDKAVAAAFRKRNKAERKGQRSLDFAGVRAEVGRDAAAIEDMREDAAADTAAKAAAFARHRDSPGWRRLKDACDLWTAAFFAKLVKPGPGQPERIPTTDSVRAALDGQTPQHLQALLWDLSNLRFFHWPLEFADVFEKGGFDVVLGNPPWDRIKLEEQEFFAGRDARIAAAPNKAARDKLIKELAQAAPRSLDLRLHETFEAAKHAADATSVFVRGSDRWPLTAVGDVNTYALFAEFFLRLLSERGRSGIVVPTGIATDDSTKAFFQAVSDGRRLASLYDFQTGGGFFNAIGHARYKFSLITVSGRQNAAETRFGFFFRDMEQFADRRRHFTLSADDIALINPNTRTCPIFRTGHDAELTKKIYRRVPVLIDEANSEAGNPWGISFLRMFDMANDSGLFRTRAQLQEAGGKLVDMVWTLPNTSRWLPLYEAKMIHHFDHRWASYNSEDDDSGIVLDTRKVDPVFRAMPRYWVDGLEVEARLVEKGWTNRWLLGCRDICRSTDERTVIASVVPQSGVGNNLPLLLPRSMSDHKLAACILMNWSALVLDYIARGKIGGSHLNFFIANQLPILPPPSYSPSDIRFIVQRTLELTYTAFDMQPFAIDLGHDGAPFRWDPARRALLRAELDAYYAWLYGLTRDELRYILDPQDIMGEDWPSETFRGLKKNEIEKFGEYRTRRLVLEAFDRFHADGTFDASRVHDPHYMPALQQQLATAKEELTLTRAELEETKRTLQALMSRADRDDKPTLFVEGTDDARIVQAAWGALFPREPLPFKVEAAGGTKQMRGLGVAGKALHAILGNRLVMALADNDGEGRALWNDSNLHKGGIWKLQTNGVWWCLLPPSDEFRQSMARFKIDAPYWPFTIENAFPAALRRQAMGEGAYDLAPTPQADLLRDQATAQRVIEALAALPADDPAHIHLRRPTPAAKDAFAAWITSPERLTPESYALFRPLLARLREIVDQHHAARAAAEPPKLKRLL